MEQIDGCHVTCIYDLLVNWILDLSYWRTTAGVRGKLLHTYGWVYRCNSDDSCSLLVGTLAESTVSTHLFLLRKMRSMPLVRSTAHWTLDKNVDRVPCIFRLIYSASNFQAQDKDGGIC